MENAITAALSRQITLAHALDVSANNIANQTTAGFKAERVRFHEYVSVIETDQGGDPTVSLVYDADSYTDFAPGALEPTHSPMDFAIEGQGFFAVQTDSGIRFTRDGHFGLNDFGELVNRDGDQVLDESGSSILIEPEDGPLLLARAGELQQSGRLVATLGVFEIDDVNSLRKIGNNLFADEITDLTPADVVVRQGFIELSNVAPVAAMTEMIEIMRAYESAARVIETSSELARNAVQTLTQNA